VPEDTTTVDETAATTPEPDVETQAFLDRLNKESGKRKDAEKKASDLEKRLADLETQMQERENAGLPELERERKAREQMEKRLADAEARAAEKDASVLRMQRENWVAAAAADAGFVNPARAARLVDDLDSIDSASDAERAVKRLAKSDQYLLKTEEKPLPGRVLEGGRPAAPGTSATRGIDTNAEAETLYEGLKKFANQWHTVE
jgi:hypothetical protein